MDKALVIVVNPAKIHLPDLTSAVNMHPELEKAIIVRCKMQRYNDAAPIEIYTLSSIHYMEWEQFIRTYGIEPEKEAEHNGDE